MEYVVWDAMKVFPCRCVHSHGKSIMVIVIVMGKLWETDGKASEF